MNITKKEDKVRTYGHLEPSKFYLISEGINVTCGKLPIALKSGRVRPGEVKLMSHVMNDLMLDVVNTPCSNVQDICDTTCSDCSLSFLDESPIKFVGLYLNQYPSSAHFFIQARSKVEIKLSELQGLKIGEDIAICHTRGDVKYIDGDIEVRPAVIASCTIDEIWFIVNGSESQEQLYNIGLNGIKLIEIV